MKFSEKNLRNTKIFSVSQDFFMKFLRISQNFQKYFVKFYKITSQIL